MRSHRNPRARLPKATTPDKFDNLDELLALLIDNVRRADAMLTALDDAIVRSWTDDDPEDSLRRRNHVSYLLEAAREAVQGGVFTGGEIDKVRAAS